MGSGGFIRKRVGMWTAPWENKSQPLIPVCNLILPQTPLFMDIGMSLFKCVIAFTRGCTFASFADSSEQPDSFYPGKKILQIKSQMMCPSAGKHLNPGAVVSLTAGGSAAALRDSSISLSD